MRKRFLLIVLVLIVVLIGFTSAAVRNVEFLGDWQNGTTFYSNESNISGYIYGKHAYPIKDGINVRTKVCEDYNKTRYRRVCRNNILGYRNVTRKRCYKKGVYGETICETKVYQIPTNRRICEKEAYNKTYTRCRWTIVNKTEIRCENPGARWTNKLSLENFKYSNNSGLFWQDVPYYRNKDKVENQSIIFKVDIPIICSPEYDINKAIFIKDL